MNSTRMHPPPCPTVIRRHSKSVVSNGSLFHLTREQARTALEAGKQLRTGDCEMDHFTVKKTDVCVMYVSKEMSLFCALARQEAILSLYFLSRLGSRSLFMLIRFCPPPSKVHVLKGWNGQRGICSFFLGVWAGSLQCISHTPPTELPSFLTVFK